MHILIFATGCGIHLDSHRLDYTTDLALMVGIRFLFRLDDIKKKKEPKYPRCHHSSLKGTFFGIAIYG